MNLENFRRALILDKPPKNTTGRNEFGMGLKTAACWFGNLWSVETSELGSNECYSATMDIRKFEKENIDSVDLITSHVPFEQHYTKITITDLNSPMAQTAVRKTKD